jgi:hypothetical protein
VIVAPANPTQQGLKLTHRNDPESAAREAASGGPPPSTAADNLEDYRNPPCLPCSRAAQHKRVDRRERERPDPTAEGDVAPVSDEPDHPDI